MKTDDELMMFLSLLVAYTRLLEELMKLHLDYQDYWQIMMTSQLKIPDP